MKDYKIAVAGTGYVGLSIATLLAQHHQVTAVDVIPEKVEKINRRISPIQDEYIEKYLAEKELNLTATLDGRKAYGDADFVVIAAPTNYDPVKNYEPRGGGDRPGAGGEPGRDDGDQEHDTGGILPEPVREVCAGVQGETGLAGETVQSAVLARIPQGEQGAV